MIWPVFVSITIIRFLVVQLKLIELAAKLLTDNFIGFLNG